MLSFSVFSTLKCLGDDWEIKTKICLETDFGSERLTSLCSQSQVLAVNPQADGRLEPELEQKAHFHPAH